MNTGTRLSADLWDVPAFLGSEVVGARENVHAEVFSPVVDFEPAADDEMARVEPVWRQWSTHDELFTFRGD